MPSTYTASTRLPYCSRTVRSRSIFPVVPGPVPVLSLLGLPGAPAAGNPSSSPQAPRPPGSAFILPPVGGAARRPPLAVGCGPVRQAWPRPPQLFPRGPTPRPSSPPPTPRPPSPAPPPPRPTPTFPPTMVWVMSAVANFLLSLVDLLILSFNILSVGPQLAGAGTQGQPPLRAPPGPAGQIMQMRSCHRGGDRRRWLRTSGCAEPAQGPGPEPS